MDKKHEIRSDILRVAAELQKTDLHRSDYIEHGKFTRIDVQKEFGTWTLAMHACGLKGSKPQRLTPIEKRIEKYGSTTAEIRERYYEHIAPFHGKYLNKPKDALTVLVAGDLHSEFIDPYFNHIFQDVNARVKPDIVAINGDCVDFPLISKYNNDPTRLVKLQPEIDFTVKNILEPLRRNNPNAEIQWLWGNHEKRLFTYLCLNPGLNSLRCLQWGKLFDLDRLKINLVARENFITQTKKKDSDTARPYLIIGNDAVMITHGTKLSKFHTQGEAQMIGHSISVVTGHTHRPQYLTMTKFRGRFWALSLGMGGKPFLGEEYIDDPIIDWGQSLALLHIYKSEAVAEHIVLGEKFTIAAGKYYFR